MRTAKPTIEDVAHLAGVSPMTVSRVLGQSGYVSAMTKERVLKAATALGYRPNYVARSLAQSRTHMLGFVISTGIWFGDILLGAEEIATEQGYEIIYTTHSHDPAVERERIETLLARQVDGLLIMSPSDIHEHNHLQSLQEHGIPFVTINRYFDALKCWRILFDYRGAVRAVLRKLWEAGHRQIAFVGGGPTHPQRAVQEQIAGYQEGVRELDNSAPLLESFGGTSPEEGEILTEALIERHPHTTALLAVNDLVASGALRALRRIGRRVPEDVAVVGFGDTLIARCTDPPLSSIHSAAREAGRLGCQRLIAQIKRPHLEPKTLYLPGSLIIRRSCGLHADDGISEIHLPLHNPETEECFSKGDHPFTSHEGRGAGENP